MREVSRGDQKRWLLGALQGRHQQPRQVACRRGAAQPTDAHRRNGKGRAGCSAAAAPSAAAAQGVLQEGQLILQAVLQAAAGGVGGLHRSTNVGWHGSLPGTAQPHETRAACACLLQCFTVPSTVATQCPGCDSGSQAAAPAASHL